METKVVRMTKIVDSTKGVWLKRALSVLGVSVSEAARAIGLDSPRRLHQHINDEGHIGSGYLSSLKEAYPELNLNYIISGEFPIFLKGASSESSAVDSLQEVVEFATGLIKRHRRHPLLVTDLAQALEKQISHEMGAHYYPSGPNYDFLYSPFIRTTFDREELDWYEQASEDERGQYVQKKVEDMRKIMIDGYKL